MNNGNDGIIKAVLVIGLDSQYNVIGDITKFTINIDITRYYNRNQNSINLLNKIIQDSLQEIAKVQNLQLYDIDTERIYNFKYNKINYIYIDEIICESESNRGANKVNLYSIGG